MAKRYGNTVRMTGLSGIKTRNFGILPRYVALKRSKYNRLGGYNPPDIEEDYSPYWDPVDLDEKSLLWDGTQVPDITFSSPPNLATWQTAAGGSCSLNATAIGVTYTPVTPNNGIILSTDTAELNFNTLTPSFSEGNGQTIAFVLDTFNFSTALASTRYIINISYTNNPQVRISVGSSNQLSVRMGGGTTRVINNLSSLATGKSLVVIRNTLLGGFTVHINGVLIASYSYVAPSGEFKSIQFRGISGQDYTISDFYFTSKEVTNDNILELEGYFAHKNLNDRLSSAIIDALPRNHRYKYDGSLFGYPLQFSPGAGWFYNSQEGSGHILTSGF